MLSQIEPMFSDIYSGVRKNMSDKMSEYMSAGGDHERSEGLLGLWKQWEYS